MKYIAMVLLIFMLGCSKQPDNQEISVLNSDSPAGVQSSEPSFFYVNKGKIGLSWLTKSDSTNSLYYSLYENDTWSKPILLVQDTSLLVNWADFPGLVTKGNYWLAWFLKFNNPNTFAYDVMVMQSNDGGMSWTKPQKLHADSTRTEHGFVSSVPAKNGFQLIWLDGRMATEDKPIFSVRSAHLSFDGNVTHRKILDDNTCTCCQTSMLNTGNDNFLALYRNRTDEEIRDIARINFTNREGHETSQIIFNDNWYIPGCPVNGPRSVLNGKEIGVAWFTMGKDGVAKVKFSTSINGGKSFKNPLVIDTDNLGRVDILSVNGSYFISFLDKTEKGSEIKITQVVKGKIMGSTSIAEVSSSRKTGFPRMALAEDGKSILVAFTQKEKERVMIKKFKF